MKKGDRVTLESHPAIRLSKYEYVKPGASLTRVLGDDPDADVATMRVDLRRMLMESLSVELAVLRRTAKAIDGKTTDEGMKALRALCEKELGGENIQAQVVVAQGEGEGSGTGQDKAKAGASVGSGGKPKPVRVASASSIFSGHKSPKPKFKQDDIPF